MAGIVVVDVAVGTDDDKYGDVGIQAHQCQYVHQLFQLEAQHQPLTIRILKIDFFISISKKLGASYLKGNGKD